MKWLFVSTLLFASTAIAGPQADGGDPTFSANNWTTGLHLLGGLGVNTAYFSSDTLNRDTGIGFNIHTNISYFAFNSVALEASINVELNRIRRLLIWDTQQTVGFRFRVPAILNVQNSASYGRIFAGRGPAVLIFKGQKPSILDLEGEGDRTQLQGDVYGVGWGVFQNAKDGSTWFLELDASGHFYNRVEAVVEKNEVPIVVDSQRVKDHSALYSLSLSFGVVLF